jgi:hypothetical protein
MGPVVDGTSSVAGFRRRPISPSPSTIERTTRLLCAISTGGIGEKSGVRGSRNAGVSCAFILRALKKSRNSGPESEAPDPVRAVSRALAAVAVSSATNNRPDPQTCTWLVTAWKILAGADLLGRHDVRPGIIPERLWRKLYVQGLSPQKAADQAAVSAYNTMSPADRLKRLKR